MYTHTYIFKLRYSSHCITDIIILLEWTIQWVLVCSQPPSPLSDFRPFSSFQKEVLYPLAVILRSPLPQPLATTDLLSVSVVFALQSLSCVQLFAPPWTAGCQAPLFFTVSWSLLKFISIELEIYLTISSSASPFSFCLQSFPASGSFPLSWLFPSGDQSIGASASPSVLSMNIQGHLCICLSGHFL